MRVLQFVDRFDFYDFNFTKRKSIMKRPRPMAFATALLLIVPSGIFASSHREAPISALDRSADIVIMLHPDYQYDPKLVPAMAHMVASGIYDVVLASRILGKGALQFGRVVMKIGRAERDVERLRPREDRIRHVVLVEG